MGGVQRNKCVKPLQLLVKQHPWQLNCMVGKVDTRFSTTTAKNLNWLPICNRLVDMPTKFRPYMEASSGVESVKHTPAELQSKLEHLHSWLKPFFTNNFRGLVLNILLVWRNEVFGMDDEGLCGQTDGSFRNKLTYLEGDLCFARGRSKSDRNVWTVVNDCSYFQPAFATARTTVLDHFSTKILQQGIPQ